MSSSTRRLCTAVACAALGAAALPAAANAEETDCTGTTAATVDNLRVPERATCVLNGTFVEGTIKVETDATLRATSVRVIGNVQAEDATRVVVDSSEVGGSIQVKQGGGAEVRETRVTGDIQLNENEGTTQQVADNDVNGSVQVMQNVGGVDISRNIIDGNLQCKENAPPPTGAGNEVQGNAEDQCETLAGGSPEAGPGNGGATMIARGSLRASNSGVVRVPLQCAASSRCSGTVRLLSRGGRAAQAAALLGSARFAIGAGKSKAVRVRLGRRGRVMLRRTSRVRIRVAVATRGEVTRRAVTLRG